MSEEPEAGTPDSLGGLVLELTAAVVGIVPRLVGRSIDQLAFARAVADRLRCRAVQGRDGSGTDQAEVGLTEPLVDELADVVPLVPRSVAVPDLAIPSYDELAASQVIPLLAGLTAPELEAVRQHEAAGRKRRTILSRVAQLQSR